MVASHGRLPGLVTHDRPRAVKEPRRGHRRGGPSPGLPRRTRRPVDRMCTEWMLACPALPGESPRGHHAPAIASRPGIRPARPHGRWPWQPCRPARRRPGQDVPGSQPSPAQARTGYGCPVPRAEPAEPLSKPCAPIANATSCPACISTHYGPCAECALMPDRAQPPGRMVRRGSRERKCRLPIARGKNYNYALPGACVDCRDPAIYPPWCAGTAFVQLGEPWASSAIRPAWSDGQNPPGTERLPGSAPMIWSPVAFSPPPRLKM